MCFSLADFDLLTFLEQLSGGNETHVPEHPPVSDHDHVPRAVSIVIPDEDPSRLFVDSAPEGDNDNLYNTFVLDGVGQEDDDPDEDVSQDPAEEHAGERAGQGLPTARTQRARPSWLMEAFNERVAEARDRPGPDKLPNPYRQGTFWFAPKATYFLLRNRKPTPQSLYAPQFFLWDPLPLVMHGIPCPNCRNALCRDGHIRYPRRVVDLKRSFWLIGYIYRCSVCTNPNTGRKGTLTFRSWDSRILAVLPPELRAEFPARLSYRSGISVQAYELLRSCIQNGMGAKQFSDTLRVQHLRHYDQTHLQYLHYLQGRRHTADWFPGEHFAPFLPFDDTSLDGYHGFILSSQWLRDLYDRGVEEHMADIDQHTSMLSGEICAIDHSHKVSHSRIRLCHPANELIQCSQLLDHKTCLQAQQHRNLRWSSLGYQREGRA